MVRQARVALLCVALFLAPRAEAEDSSLKIYAAASTKDAVEKIAKQFQGETSIAVEVSPGPSSKLAKQIVEGAPADLTILAPDLPVTVDAKTMKSRSKNTPFDGWTLTGGVAATLVGGRTVYLNGAVTLAI